jgi:hypothetical protein
MASDTSRAIVSPRLLRREGPAGPPSFSQEAGASDTPDRPMPGLRPPPEFVQKEASSCHPQDEALPGASTGRRPGGPGGQARNPRAGLFCLRERPVPRHRRRDLQEQENRAPTEETAFEGGTLPTLPHGGGHCPGGFRPPRLSGEHFAGVYGRDAHLQGPPGEDSSEKSARHPRRSAGNPGRPPNPQGEGPFHVQRSGAVPLYCTGIRHMPKVREINVRCGGRFGVLPSPPAKRLGHRRAVTL